MSHIVLDRNVCRVYHRCELVWVSWYPAVTSSPLLLQALHDQVAAAVQEISILIEPIAVAARSEASELGHKVNKYPAGTVKCFTTIVITILYCFLEALTIVVTFRLGKS